MSNRQNSRKAKNFLLLALIILVLLTSVGCSDDDKQPDPIVTLKEIVEESIIPYKTIEKNDDTLDAGKTVVKTEGKDGIHIDTYELIITDGVEGEKEHVSSEIKVEPVDKVVHIGTKKPKKAPTESPKQNNQNTNKPKPKPKPESKKETFKNCGELRKKYPEGVPKGHPAYAPKHDRDKDDWACELNSKSKGK